jgi:hypothetical protein
MMGPEIFVETERRAIGRANIWIAREEADLVFSAFTR